MMHYIGCDVSKKKLDFCLLIKEEVIDEPTGQRDRTKYKTVENTKSGIKDFVRWLAKNHVTDISTAHIAMEGTGVYHEIAAHEITQHGAIVSVCNPAQTKSFGKGLGIRNKNDEIDSYVLACFCEKVNPRPWTPCSPEAYTLRMLVARTDAITSDLTRFRNRAEKAAATQTPEIVLHSIDEAIKFHKNQLLEIQEEIERHITNHESLKNDMSLLTSIPAIGKRCGAAMLATLHRYTFDSAEQLAAYIGLVPIMRKSGTSLSGKPRMSRQGPKSLRALLYMAAVCAIRKNGNPVARALYERLLLKGKAKKAALGAVMRKLAHICYGVFRSKTPFCDEVTADAQA
jgi:transposase